MNYGLPYQGSKNAIAEWVVGQLPEAETFVDLFCGGCAITHAAMLSGKYKNFIANDIIRGNPILFKECAAGWHRVKDHLEWISRRSFFQRKASETWVNLCYSFGNGGENYAYAAEIEPWRRALHFARVLGNFDHARFYDWAREQNNIFISEYQMPGDFVELNSIRKLAMGSRAEARERLYTNQQTAKNRSWAGVDLEFRQYSLFDLLD